MSVTPLGMPITQLYRWYREGNLLVNRRYQRKLVWTIAEKQRLIESILLGYPIPLFLLARTGQIIGDNEQYEIIDGMQRLNAIFSFIEQGFSRPNGKYFDVSEFASARNYSSKGAFSIVDSQNLISPIECANIVEYQLAVTIYPTNDESEITDVFGRINSSGKQLSNQERRQAGVVTSFAELVRQIASELRGDVSQEILKLTEMPEISIDSRISNQGYGLLAEDTLWCKQGIIRMPQLRDSEDEEIIADIAASILSNSPLSRSRPLLDDLYDNKSKNYKELERSLNRYTPEKLSEVIKTTFSVMRETIETYDNSPNVFRKTVNPNAGGNAVKTEFYAVFMSFFDLIITKECTPDNPKGIMEALNNLHSRLERASSNTIKSEIRRRHIAVTTGLIQSYFVKKDPPLLGHGPGLALEFENSIRRSRIETPRYEFKQGWLTLSPSNRQQDTDFIPRLCEHICGIANIGPDSTGYIYIGVADKIEDAKKIENIDSVNYITLSDKFIVGVDREARFLAKSFERYCDDILNGITNSMLSDPLKSQVLSYFDTVEYKGLSILRIVIPTQSKVSFVGDDVFVRQGSSTIKVKGQKLSDLFGRFRS